MGVHRSIRRLGGPTGVAQPQPERVGSLPSLPMASPRRASRRTASPRSGSSMRPELGPSIRSSRPRAVSPEVWPRQPPSTPEGKVLWGYIDTTGAWVIEPRFAAGLPLRGRAGRCPGGPGSRSRVANGATSTGRAPGPSSRNGTGWNPSRKWAWRWCTPRTERASSTALARCWWLRATPTCSISATGWPRCGSTTDSTTECYWGYIDLSGREVVEPTCSVALSFSNGLGMVTLGGAR